MAESDYTPDEEAESSLASKVMNAWTTSFRALASKQAQKAYLGTFLLAATSVLMLCVSSIAYGIFYLKFIPQVGLERVVHLQFGEGHPWGIALVGRELVSLQPYDVDVKLELPRTPSNLAAGNFMLDLTLFSRPSTSEPTGPNTAIAKSRRPAILTYASSMVDTASKLSLMPFYVVGWHREAETLEVRMMEEVEFPRGWRNLPESLRLEIHSDERMQVYSAKVLFRAKLSGLRWIMYNWRLTSFLVFSFSFWSVSMLSTSVVWIALASRAGSSSGFKVKGEHRSGTESDDGTGDSSSQGSGSDSSGGPPKGRRIKKEEEPEGDMSDIPVDQVAGSHADAGAGTGLESPVARGMQRRRSRTFEIEGS